MPCTVGHGISVVLFIVHLIQLININPQITGPCYLLRGSIVVAEYCSIVLSSTCRLSPLEFIYLDLILIYFKFSEF